MTLSPAVHLPAGVHYGEEERSVLTGRIAVRELFHGSGQRLPWHSHENAMICAILGGGFRETHESGGWEEGRGAVIYRGPGEPHEDRFSKAGARCLVAEIDACWLEAVSKEAPVPEGVVCTANGRSGLFSKALSREWLLRDNIKCLAWEGLVLLFLDDLSRVRASTTRGVPGWMILVEQVVQDRFREALTLSDLASEVGVHPVTVAKGFRTHHHCTAGEYVRALRLRRAVALLLRSDDELSDVSLAAGFYDQSHLTNTMRRVLGVTPGRLRSTRTTVPPPVPDQDPRTCPVPEASAFTSPGIRAGSVVRPP